MGAGVGAAGGIGAAGLAGGGAGGGAAIAGGAAAGGGALIGGFGSLLAGLGAGIFSQLGISSIKDPEFSTFPAFDPGRTFRGAGADPLANRLRSFLLDRLRTPGAEHPALQSMLRLFRSGQGQRERALLQKLRESDVGEGRILGAQIESKRAAGEAEANFLTAAGTQFEALRTQGIFQFLGLEAQEEAVINQLRLAELGQLRDFELGAKGLRLRADIAQAQRDLAKKELFLGALGGGGGGGIAGSIKGLF
jgi:hypothetical protein